MKDHTRENLEAYNAIADIYDEVFKRPFQTYWDEKIRDLLNKHVATVEPFAGRKAIDLGCGTAVYSNALSDKGYHVVAVDISPRMIQVAKESISTRETRVTTLQSDILDLEIPGGDFEVAISFGSVINHINPEEEGWDTFFAKASELLAPNGLFIFDIENVFGVNDLFSSLYSRLSRKPEAPTPIELVKRVISRIGYKPFVTSLLWEVNTQSNVHLRYTYRSLRAIKKLLRARGFQIVELDGTNLFSCILPKVSLSATYEITNSNGTPSTFRQILHRLDKKLGKPLHHFAATQFVVARKV